MSAVRRKILHGISEFGRVTYAGDPLVATYTPFSNTDANGVSLTLNPTMFEVKGGQSLMALEAFPSAVDAKAAVVLVAAGDLGSLATVLGITASVGGDLTLTTPTDETLTINGDDIGAADGSAWYFKSQGAGVGKRIVVFTNAKIYLTGPLPFKQSEDLKLTCTLALFPDSTGAVVKFTDAAV